MLLPLCMRQKDLERNTFFNRFHTKQILPDDKLYLSRNYSDLSTWNPRFPEKEPLGFYIPQGGSYLTLTLSLGLAFYLTSPVYLRF